MLSDAAIKDAVEMNWGIVSIIFFKKYNPNIFITILKKLLGVIPNILIKSKLKISANELYLRSEGFSTRPPVADD